MKRALLLLLLLVLMLALAVWFARDGSRVPAGGAPSVVGEFVVADATPAGLDATGDETMGKREGLAPGGAVPATREPTLAIRVVFARTDEPVDGGSGELLYTHPLGTFTSGQVPTQMRSLHLDAHGRCVVSLPAGAHLLSLRIEPLSTIVGARGGFLRRRLELDQDLGSAGGELRIEVESAPELAGRVLDAVTLAPVAGARISLTGREQFLPPAETELDGWFSLGPFGPLPAGIVLAIEHPDYPAASRIVDLHEAAAVEIRLARGFRVSGRIVDGKGTPVGQGRLELHLVRLHGQGDTRALRTKVDTLSDASGEFRFPPVWPPAERRSSSRPSCAPPRPTPGSNSSSDCSKRTWLGSSWWSRARSASACAPSGPTARSRPRARFRSMAMESCCRPWRRPATGVAAWSSSRSVARSRWEPTPPAATTDS